MEPSQTKNEENGVQKDHEERVNKMNSDIQKTKQRFFKEFEDSSDDSRKRRPKRSQSGKNQLEITQIETPTSEQRPFAPFVANTLQLKGDEGISFDAVSYNEKYNLIIACPFNESMQFYDATTLLPSEQFETKRLDDPTVSSMSYCSQSETYLLGCGMMGKISAFSLLSQVLQSFQKQACGMFVTVTFLNSKYYAFATLLTSGFFIGNLENEDVLRFKLQNEKIINLYCLERTKFLLSSHNNGSMHIYRTDRLPKLPMIGSIRGYDSDKIYPFLRGVQSMIIRKKEYILTIGADCKIRIWHFIKGKMRKLKVIHTEDDVCQIVYLEDYKVLATAHETKEIKFWRFPSGRLESKLDSKMQYCSGILLMKDKNCLGVTNSQENKINIVKLHQ